MGSPYYMSSKSRHRISLHIEGIDKVVRLNQLQRDPSNEIRLLTGEAKTKMSFSRRSE
jgi:hypothetical protein